MVAAAHDTQPKWEELAEVHMAAVEAAKARYQAEVAARDRAPGVHHAAE